MTEQSKFKLYRELFLSAFKLSAFTFGGGYVIVPLMRRRFVEELKWIEESEMLDMVSIAQSSPGPIAVNAAIIIGYRVAGVPGALVTVLGTVLPPLVIISIISFFYEQFQSNVVVARVLTGMRAGVAAVIVTAVLGLGASVVRADGFWTLIEVAAVFVAVRFLKISIMIVIPVCAIAGILYGRLTARAKKRADGLGKDGQK